MGQTLSALRLQLVAGRDRNQPVDLGMSVGAIDGIIDSVRSLSHDLRPSMLDDLGLVPALRWLAERQAALGGVEMEAALEPEDRRYPASIQNHCYRIAQEAIGNALRHSHCERIAVRLSQQAGRLVLEVGDDGVGFDAEAQPQTPDRVEHFGLASMRERASALGGSFDVRSSPEGGTMVTVMLPLEESG